MSLYRRFTKGFAIAGAAGLVFAAVAGASGARVNTTKSIPLGLYWTSTDPVVKGRYVLFCPPPVDIFEIAKDRGYIGAGFCPGGYGYMMKRILAAKKDAIEEDALGVRVNGELLPFSVPRPTDAAGRPMPRFQTNHYTLGDNEVLLMSDVSSTSFDGRYFGPVMLSQIMTVIHPVITW
jgi:conjugative transfer signal peptidase TraF